MVIMWTWSCCYNGRCVEMVVLLRLSRWGYGRGAKVVGVVNVVLLRWSGCGNNRGAEVVGYGKSHGGLDDCP